MAPKCISHIAIVCTGFPIPTETFVLNQVAGFLKLGISVSVFPYRKWPPLPGLYRDTGMESRVFETIIPPKNYLYRILQATSLLWRHRKHFFRLVRTLNPFVLGMDAVNLTVFYSAIPFLGHPDFDLVIAHFGENGIGMEKMMRCGFLRAPLVTVFHGYDLHWYNGGLEKKQTDYRKLFLNGKAFVANGRYGLEKLKILGAPAEQCYIVPAGLKAEDFKNPERREPPELRFCSVGRLMPLKGHHIALAAFEILYKKGITHWEYTVAGDGEQLESLKKQIKLAGIDHLVKLSGHLNHSEIINLLSRSTVYIHPSITDNTGRAETQGLAIQEAQAMGLPVLAFDSGGISDGVPPGTGILVPEGDATALSEAIEKLVNNPGLRKQMGEAGSKWALENYDLLKLNQRILQIAGFSG